jgi:sn-glycerol 3-phosphate transport system substrate-binding protein
MVRDFNASHEDVIVEPIFSGGYRETMERAQTAYLSGNAPEVAVLDAPAALDLIEMGAIVPLDTYIEAEGGDEYISKFLSGFMEIARLEGQTWSIPFQRSTPLFYYNKDHFAAAGLDPDSPPTTWEEVVEYSAVLADHFGADSTRWPIQVPINFWLLKPLVLQAGGEFESEDGRSVSIDTPEMREAFGYLLDLIDRGYMAPIRQWAPSVSDFIAGNVSMLYNSTGSLGHIERSADFEVGTGFLPMYKREVVIEGGGNFFIFNTDERRQAAAWEFVTWMTNAENAARWSIESGYVAVREDAYDLPVYIEHVENHPNAITAFRQLQSVDVERNFMSYQQAQLAELLNEMKEDILGGDDLDSTLVDAQAAADEILARFQ